MLNSVVAAVAAQINNGIGTFRVLTSGAKTPM